MCIAQNTTGTYWINPSETPHSSYWVAFEASFGIDLAETGQISPAAIKSASALKSGFSLLTTEFRKMAFQKGVSGNPSGRPKECPEVKALARQHTKTAIERLAYWLKSKDARASVTAATALLDRGYGKPAQAMTGGDGEGPVEVTIKWKDSKAD